MFISNDELNGKVFSKLNYYYEGGRTLFRTPGWCFFKLENSGLKLPVFPRILRYLQYSYFGNDQYFLVLQILDNSGRYWNTSIYQYLYQYCRYWKILVIPVLQILED
jgi:hypothetical protein